MIFQYTCAYCGMVGTYRGDPRVIMIQMPGLVPENLGSSICSRLDGVYVDSFYPATVFLPRSTTTCACNAIGPTSETSQVREAGKGWKQDTCERNTVQFRLLGSGVVFVRLLESCTVHAEPHVAADCTKSVKERCCLLPLKPDVPILEDAFYIPGETRQRWTPSSLCSGRDSGRPCNPDICTPITLVEVLRSYPTKYYSVHKA
ncbi:uncharacterized protein B0T15DRAFT_290479 [Chaetomium strumarium]|uniref:Uncharacterized protein n=1 Tax=Chaetomium strumarium TaxID=1170767 RepID=A0AAJ0GLD4_9PEZI|nr:hypothetical protein B0T15DRAFT_290479 [Chaetomium strumarium]